VWFEILALPIGIGTVYVWHEAGENKSSQPQTWSMKKARLDALMKIAQRRRMKTIAYELAITTVSVSRVP